VFGRPSSAGRLQMMSISGDVRLSVLSPIAVRELSDIEAAAIVGLAIELEGGDARFVRGIDPVTESLSWQYEFSGGSGLIDEETEIVVRNASSDGAVVSRSCGISYRDLVRDGSGRVTDISKRSPTVYTTYEICEGDTHFFDDNCDFKLRDMAHNQALEQIDDAADGPGANIAQDYIINVPCSTVNPNFNSTNSNDAEQREAYVALKQVARTARQKFFSQYTPQSNKSVELHTDYDGGQLSNARYDDFFEEIYFFNDSVAPHIVWHEYGHHVANMYGNMSNNCTAFTDEGDSIDEAVGAATAMTVLATGTTSVYGAAVSLGIGLYGPHSSSNGPLVYGASACNGTPHSAARPFAQAYWEVLSNRDCLLNGCPESTAMFINSASSLIPNATQTAHQDEVARSLAYALSATPASTTYASVVAFMNARWVLALTGPQAAKLRAVFTHHGI
jgi:hypothetical protein